MIHRSNNWWWKWPPCDWIMMDYQMKPFHVTRRDAPQMVPFHWEVSCLVQFAKSAWSPEWQPSWNLSLDQTLCELCKGWQEISVYSSPQPYNLRDLPPSIRLCTASINEKDLWEYIHLIHPSELWSYLPFALRVDLLAFYSWIRSLLYSEWLHSYQAFVLYEERMQS